MIRKAWVIITAALTALSVNGAAAQDANIQLREVVVTASRTEKDPKDVTQSVTVITAEDIKRSGATSAAEVIAQTVGTEVTNYGPAGAVNTLRIRGADYSRVLVLLDGVRLNSPRDLGFDLSALPVSIDAIERIEIVRGPASALYGSEAVGGVVNIITKKARGSERRIGATAGSHGYDLLSLGIGTRSSSYSYRLEGARQTYDGYRPNSDLEQWTYSGNIDVRFGDRVTLELTGSYTNKENGSPGPKQQIVSTDRQWDRIFVSGAGLTMRPTENLKIKARGSKTKEALQYHFSYGDSRHDSDTTIAEGQMDYLLGTWSALTLGYESRKDKLDSSDTGLHTTSNTAFYVQDDVSLGESFIVVVGARRDDHSLYGAQTSPKVSGRYRTKSSGTIIRASYGKSFRSPTPNDLFFPFMSCPDFICGITIETVGNPDLKPERAKEYEAGIEQPLGNSTVKAVAYVRKVEDMIIWLETFPTPTVSHWEPANVGRADIRGYEAEITLRPVERTEVGLNYSYVNPLNEATGEKIPFIPKHQWKGSLSVGVDERTTLRLEGRATRNYVTPGEPVWQYSVLDVKITERMKGSAAYSGEMFIGVTNIFDRVYEVVKNYPMPPREIKGGITVSF